MNIIINEKAYDFIIKKGGTLVIKAVNIPCGWAGSTKSLWAEALKSFENNGSFNFYEKDGVKIYIYNKLNVSETVEISLNPHFPFMDPSFNIKGIYV